MRRRIAGTGQLGSHVDTNRYWQDHLRVHVPVITDPTVRFRCGDDEVNMAAGEAWVFDTWRAHGVVNPAGFDRVHLVVDTVGSAALWDLIDRGGGEPSCSVEPGSGGEPVYERAMQPQVTSAWQHGTLAQALLADLGP